ncbi:PQQ-binding-like beta-propeller repeat protein [Actinoplanes sp. NPDC051346]|uniref:outer membrane protein assembly factor BamB family protein n=1 Tax=Actinoplanes sp. NPDC051346 TaxID=3155048 RepID=UPI003413A996
MSVIDLGLVANERDNRAEKTRPRLRLGDFRWMLVVATAALCVLTLTGSARPEWHGPRDLWSVPLQGDNDTFTVGSDMLYVQRGQDRELIAYGARDGAVRWTSDKLGEAPWLAEESGVLLLPAAVETRAADHGHGLREVTGESVALDAATGRELWRRPGEVAATGDGRALLIERDEDTTTIRALHVVRLRDGTPLWSQPGSGATNWAGGGTPILTTESLATTDRLATIGNRGRVRIRDMATGRVVATAVVPWVGRNEEGESFNNVLVEGHTLYVENVKRGKGTLVAYDTETMRRKWRIAERTYGGFYPCGAVLCVNQEEGVSGFDRDTGARRWRIDGAPIGMPLSHGGVLVASAEGGSHHSVIDTATGKRLSDIGSGALAANSSGREEALYVLAPVFQPRDQMAVSKIEDTGRVVLRGAVGPIDQTTCQNSGELLFCMTPDGRLAVTDVG